MIAKLSFVFFVNLFSSLGTTYASQEDSGKDQQQFCNISSTPENSFNIEALKRFSKDQVAKNKIEQIEKVCQTRKEAFKKEREEAKIIGNINTIRDGEFLKTELLDKSMIVIEYVGQAKNKTEAYFCEKFYHAIQKIYLNPIGKEMLHELYENLREKKCRVVIFPCRFLEKIKVI